MTSISELSQLAMYAGVSREALAAHLLGTRPLGERATARVRQAVTEFEFDVDRWIRLQAPPLCVGLLVPNVFSPFFSTLATELEVAAHDSGCDLMVLPSGGRLATELRHVERFVRGELQGLVIATNNGSDERLSALCRELPGLVVVHEEIVGCSAPIVSSDDVSGGSLAAEHLLQHGHRQTTYLAGPRDVRSSADRAQGFKLRMSDAGGTVRTVFGDFSEQHGYDTIMRLARDGRLSPAICAGSDTLAIGALKALRELGLDVPTDVSLVAIDGTSTLAYAEPLLSCVTVPLKDIAIRAMDYVLRHNRHVPSPRLRHRLPMSLQHRQSVAMVGSPA